jgi:ElaB/YqjD/DUF883 family membrane-anchored ribosome-binding protein
VGNSAPFEGTPGSEPIFDESGTITGDTYDAAGPEPVYLGDASDTHVGAVDTESTTDTDGDDELEATRVQIEQTRAELTETIDAIQSKLSPANVVQEAKDTVREATVGRAQDMVNNAGDTAADVGGSIVDTIKRNPVPAALAGISLGWLIMNRSKGTPSRSSRNGGYGQYPRGYYPSSSQYGAYQSNDVDYTGQTGGSSDQGAMGRAAAAASGTVGDAMDQVQSSVSDAMNQVQSTAGDVVSNAGDTASDLGSTIVETIRQNPIPAALTGIGLGWLITKLNSGGSQSGSSTRDGYYNGYSTGYPTSYSGYQSSNWDYGSASSAGSTVDQARQNLGQAADQVQGTVSSAVNQAQDTAGQVASQVQSQVSQVGYQTQQVAQQATTGVQSMMQNNPLAVGAAVVAVGLAIGLAVPETEKEDELMGQARAGLTDRAQQVVQDTAQKVQNVAQEAVGAAKQEAQEQSLM